MLHSIYVRILKPPIIKNCFPSLYTSQKSITIHGILMPTTMFHLSVLVVVCAIQINCNPQTVKEIWHRAYLEEVGSKSNPGDHLAYATTKPFN